MGLLVRFTSSLLGNFYLRITTLETTNVIQYPDIHLFILLATYNLSSLVFKEGQELYLHAVAVNKNKNTSPDTKNFGKKLKIATASKN